MILAGETEVLGENLPSATLSTTNPTWIDPGANPGLRGERPATNRLSHGTAFWRTTIAIFHHNLCGMFPCILYLFTFLVLFLGLIHLFLYEIINPMNRIFSSPRRYSQWIQLTNEYICFSLDDVIQKTVYHLQNSNTTLVIYH
jgi:hypothetical protein